jgi:hypothetical protein
MYKVCKKCNEDKSVEAFNKNPRRKDGLGDLCKPCMAEYRKAYKEKHHQRILDRQKQYRNANKEKIRETKKQIYERNLKAETIARRSAAKAKKVLAEQGKKLCNTCKQVLPFSSFYALNKKLNTTQNRCKVCHKVWFEQNKEYIYARKSKWLANKPTEYRDAWGRNNRDMRNSRTQMRRAARIQRTPCWLTENDKALIQRKYTLAQTKTESTGERWVVDHILPLQGKLVSGLHVPANLRVIKESTNLRKSNKFVPA